MRRLSLAGFKKDFVRPAILPDWWDDSCAEDPNVLPDIEIRVARFLGLPLSTIRDPRTPVTPPGYPGVQLRRVRDLDLNRMAPAIHSAIQVAGAVVRNFRDPAPGPALLPADGVAWRGEIQRTHAPVTLDDILTSLWGHGIPVVPAEVLPTPSFQGIACIAEGRPVIVIGHRHEEPGRVAFLVAHEAGHIAGGDCTADCPVVDEDAEIADATDMEGRADRYATRVLAGDDAFPRPDAADYRELAKKACQLERDSGADAGGTIFAWASRTGDFATASLAVKALYRGSGARRKVREHYDRHVDLDAATESDRALLRCVFGERDAVGA